ncbi:MAG: NAD(P)-dependent oxidoreductase [Lautropia sp.]
MPQMDGRDVGFVGLGMMGQPLALALARDGRRVHVFDTRADALAAASSIPGIVARGSPAEVASAASIVFTCLPSIEAIESVYLSDGGIVSAVRDGSVVCELSTTSPELSAEIARRLSTAGARFAEAPMIGPPSAAREQALFFIVGCDARTLAALDPLLRGMGRAYRHVGDVGAASRAKLLHNSLGMIHAAATAEVLGLCLKVGVDADAFVDVIREAAKSRGVGYSTFFDLHAPDILRARDGGAGRLYIGAKDAHLAHRMAQSANYPSPLLREADAMFAEAMSAGWGSLEFSAVSKVVEKRLGETLFGQAQADRDENPRGAGGPA